MMTKWYGPLWAGVGAALTIGILGWLNLSWHVALVMAPFGASCVLLFSLPDSPLARPKNVLGGHLLTACVGLVIGLLPLPAEVQMALATGLAIALMQGLNIPPSSSGRQSLADPDDRTRASLPVANGTTRNPATDGAGSWISMVQTEVANCSLKTEGGQRLPLSSSQHQLARNSR